MVGIFSIVFAILIFYKKLPFWEIILYICKNIYKIVRVIAKGTLRDFWLKHSDTEQQLKSWYSEAEQANWKSPNDIKKDYPSAIIIQGNRVVFNIKGNSYRLIVKINYSVGIVWIRFIGTHKEYDVINAEII